MCKFICSLYDNHAYITTYEQFLYSEPELPIVEVTKKGFYRWLGAPGERRKTDATARSPRYPPLDSVSALVWSERVERRCRKASALARKQSVNDQNDEASMLVTFRSKASADVVMFGDVAVRLIKLMGHSGVVPSAILAEDVGAALCQLKQAVEADKAGATGEHSSQTGIDTRTRLP